MLGSILHSYLDTRIIALNPLHQSLTNIRVDVFPIREVEHFFFADSAECFDSIVNITRRGPMFESLNEYPDTPIQVRIRLEVSLEERIDLK